MFAVATPDTTPDATSDATAGVNSKLPAAIKSRAVCTRRNTVSSASMRAKTSPASSNLWSCEYLRILIVNFSTTSLASPIIAPTTRSTSRAYSCGSAVPEHGQSASPSCAAEQTGASSGARYLRPMRTVQRRNGITDSIASTTSRAIARVEIGPR